jgi:hypothetical protein
MQAKWDEMFGMKEAEVVEEVKVKKPRKKAGKATVKKSSAKATKSKSKATAKKDVKKPVKKKPLGK